MSDKAETGEVEHEHEKCCSYLRCAHPKCCGYYGPPKSLRRGVKVYHQGTSVYVIGTDDTNEALNAVGIAPTTHRWSSTDFGWFVRRQGRWQGRSDYMLPKDAKRGVCFVGAIREVTTPSGQETP